MRTFLRWLKNLILILLSIPAILFLLMMMGVDWLLREEEEDNGPGYTL